MINGNIYIVSYQEFKEQLLPLLLRRPKWLALLQALISPLVSLYDEFFLFKTDAIYKTEHNAAITLLQKVLNDAYDDVERRIFINNAEITNTQHYYDDGSGDPLDFYDEGSGDPQWFFNMETFNVYSSDFTVFIPIALKPADPDDEVRYLDNVRADLDYYKIYGTKYTIVWLS